MAKLSGVVSKYLLVLLSTNTLTCVFLLVFYACLGASGNLIEGENLMLFVIVTFALLVINALLFLVWFLFILFSVDNFKLRNVLYLAAVFLGVSLGSLVVNGAAMFIFSDIYLGI